MKAGRSSGAPRADGPDERWQTFSRKNRELAAVERLESVLMRPTAFHLCSKESNMSGPVKVDVLVVGSGAAGSLPR